MSKFLVSWMGRGRIYRDEATQTPQVHQYESDLLLPCSGESSITVPFQERELQKMWTSDSELIAIDNCSRLSPGDTG